MTTAWPPSREEIDAMSYGDMADVLKERGVADVPKDGDGRRAALRAMASSALRSEPKHYSALEEVRATAVDVGAEAPGISADVSLAAEPPRDDEDHAAAVERIRKMRRPFGSSTRKLELAQRPNYKRHWFNDTGARVQEYLDSGWAHVKDQKGQPLKRAVGTGRDNGVLYAYAMELPEEFWLEDMAARHEQAKARMDAVKQSPFQAKPGTAQRSDQGKFYSPVEGADPIQITPPRPH